MAKRNDCPRPMTARERREYNKNVERGGQAYIDAQHRQFKAQLAQHNAQHGLWHWLWHG